MPAFRITPRSVRDRWIADSRALREPNLRFREIASRDSPAREFRDTRSRLETARRRSRTGRALGLEYICPRRKCRAPIAFRNRDRAFRDTFSERNSVLSEDHRNSSTCVRTRDCSMMLNGTRIDSARRTLRLCFRMPRGIVETRPSKIVRHYPPPSGTSLTSRQE